MQAPSGGTRAASHASCIHVDYLLLLLTPNGMHACSRMNAMADSPFHLHCEFYSQAHPFTSANVWMHPFHFIVPSCSPTAMDEKLNAMVDGVVV